MTQTDRRALRDYERAIQRLAWAPKGKHRERLEELQAQVKKMLAAELEQPANAA